MGYNDEHARTGLSKWLAFDLETDKRDEAVALVPEPEPDKRLSDPAKIAADLERKRAEAIRRLSLDMNGCRIVALGYQTEEMAGPEIMLESEAQERTMLTHFWIVAKGSTLIGFRSRTFDLPIILQRSRLLGVPVPPWRDLLAPYGRSKRHIDLYDEATFDGIQRDNVIPRRLQTHGDPAMFNSGIPHDDCDGKDIADLVAAGDYVAIGLHCARDVDRTVALARALRIIPQVTIRIPPAHTLFGFTSSRRGVLMPEATDKCLCGHEKHEHELEHKRPKMGKP